MARILIVYKEFPAAAVGHAGGQGVYRLIEHLHRRGHQVSLVARLRREEEPLVPETRDLCEDLFTVPHHRALSGPLPLTLLLSYLRLRRATVRALRTVRPDLLFVEFAQTATVLLGLRRPFAALRPHDVNWFLMEQRLPRLSGPRRWLVAALARFFRWFEPWLCQRYDQILAISMGDQRLLAPRCAPQPVRLLPLAPGLPADLDVEPALVPRPNVLFVGAMYRAVNVEAVEWFVERVWPQIRAEIPSAHFTVVGYRPPPKIEALDREADITVTGFVDDLAPWYRSADVFVSPMLVAGGLLQKVLDALATGVPIVATSVSNHGIGATPGEHLLTADDPANFAAAVVRLLRHPEERRALGRAGQQFAEATYDLEAAIKRWEKSWEDDSDKD